MSDAMKPATTAALRDDLQISTLVKGCFQQSTQYLQQYGARGSLPESVQMMLECADHGITSFDGADIYIGVEEMIGRFLGEYRQRHGDTDDITVLTKFIPDAEDLAKVNAAYVRRIIELSLQRLKLEQLPLVQFHWYDYRVPRYLEVMQWLDDLKRDGKIRHLGLTNFNTDVTAEILDAGFDIVSTQVHYSIVDQRPRRRLAQLCLDRNLRILAYGSLCGGFLSDAWLGREAPPPSTNKKKWASIVTDAGGWDALQAVLRVLRGVADKHGVQISTVAQQYILSRPEVAAVLVGAHSRPRLDEALAVWSCGLDEMDVQAIEAAIAELSGTAGDVFDQERDFDSPHGQVNLNRRGRHHEDGTSFDDLIPA